jgi:hypothetical protein
MLKCKKSVYADCRRGRRKTAPFLSVATDRKEKNISTIEEFAEIVDEEIKRH